MLARGVLMEDALVVERNRNPRLRQALVHTYPGMPQRCLEGMELCLYFDHVIAGALDRGVPGKDSDAGGRLLLERLRMPGSACSFLYGCCRKRA